MNEILTCSPKAQGLLTAKNIAPKYDDRLTMPITLISSPKSRGFLTLPNYVSSPSPKKTNFSQRFIDT